MTRSRSLRINVTGTAPLEIQLDTERLARVEPPARGEHVAPIAPTPADRRLGRRRYEVVIDGWRFETTVEPADRALLRERAARAAAGQESLARISVRAQIPGRVVRLWVADGQAVEQGERLLAIEAMKMENEIRAPRAGVVAGLKIELGQRVEREDELLTVG